MVTDNEGGMSNRFTSAPARDLQSKHLVSMSGLREQQPQRSVSHSCIPTEPGMSEGVAAEVW